MAFPFAPLSTNVEIYYSGSWHSIPSRVYQRDGIQITRGRPNEAVSVDPSTMHLTINNRDGIYSPRNPRSSLYGLIGRNTPIRVSVLGYDVVAETFNRVPTSTDRWGICEFTGTIYSTAGTGGSVVDADWVMSAGVATNIMTTANSFRVAYIASPIVSLTDLTCSVKVRFQDPASSPTYDVKGADAEGGLMMRVQSSTSYYHPRLEFNADQTLTASLHAIGGTGSLGSATVASVTNTGQWFIVKGQCSGTTIRMKVWADGTAEPSAWTVSVTNGEITAAGGVGFRSGRATGNTNTLPLLQYDDFTMDPAYRFWGEVTSWPQKWTIGGKDIWTPIECAGLGRRLNAPGTSAPATSAMYNVYVDEAPKAWWTLETGDGRATTNFSSALTGGIALTASPASAGSHQSTGAVGGSTVGPAGAASAVDLSGGGQLSALLASGTTSQSYRIELSVLFTEPVDPLDSGQIIRINNGTNGVIGLFSGSTPGTETTLELQDADTFVSVGTSDILDDGNWHLIQLDLSPAGGGANTAYTLYINGVNSLSGTAVGVVFGAATQLTISPTGDLSAASHAVYWYGTLPSFITSYDAFTGHAGEYAGGRLARLALQEGIALSVLGDVTEMELMGAQGAKPVLELMQECADADGGILYEPRSFLGFAYRGRRTLYNQTPVAALTYSADGEVAHPLEPVEDDDSTANDVTVTRLSGGFANVVQATGTLNVQEPGAAVGAVGRYKQDKTLVLFEDDQCISRAAWLRHLGTWDEARYPVINVSITNMARVGLTSLIPDVASLNIGDRFTIDSPPSWLPGDAIDQHAQGFTETLNAFAWEIGANATPALPYDVIVIEDDTTTNKSRIPAGVSTLNVAVNTTSTVLEVSHATVPWIDTTNYAAMIPFDIEITGERMTVTAVTNNGAAFIAAGTAGHANNTSVVPAIPGSVTGAGDLLLIFAAIRNFEGSPVAPAGYSTLFSFGNCALFGKIHSGTESSPTVTFTGGIVNATTSAQMASFRNVQLLVEDSNYLTNEVAADIAVSGVRTKYASTTVLYLGWKQDDWTSVATIAGATEIGEPSSTTGDDQGIVWDYLIKTSPGAVAASSFVVTGGTNQISKGGAVVLSNSATQFFVVTRSVNNVSKSHSINEAVQIFQPAAIAQ